MIGKSAKVLACLAEIRKILFEDIDCICGPPYPGIAYAYSARKCARCRALDNIEKQREAGKLLGSFAPKGPVPEGLDITFYHTLSYESEVILQDRINAALAVFATPSEGSEG